MGKRLFDILISFLGLLILLPFFIILVIIIRIDSKGSPFYKQDRVGRGGALFKLIKLRTMRTDADKGSAITVGNRDPRITRCGYYLRKYKLDELPQLFNVLIGDMSLVGPRPEVQKFVSLYTAEQRKILSIRPGLTDYASILFRNENQLLEGKEDPIEFYIREIMPVKLDLNLKYMKQQSIWVDMTILLKTGLLIIKG